ncbi:MAG: RHS repeat-associated core domain-containing protein, partial [Planctomycetes bacterium]|nr:RHS repeat-associated core domain-containing protein [Planctomycetota bacterium]
MVIGNDMISQQVDDGTSASSLVLLTDGHGSTRLLVDEAGAIPASGAVFAYDGFGNALGFAPSAALTTLLYSGEQTDPTTGLQFLRRRYYEAANAQFLTVDPHSGDLETPQSLHKYLYCGGDPVNNIDPNGEFFSLFDVLGGLAGHLKNIATAGMATSVGQWMTRAIVASVLSGGLFAAQTAYLMPLASALDGLAQEVTHFSASRASFILEVAYGLRKSVAEAGFFWGASKYTVIFPVIHYSIVGARAAKGIYGVMHAYNAVKEAVTLEYTNGGVVMGAELDIDFWRIAESLARLKLDPAEDVRTATSLLKA